MKRYYTTGSFAKMANVSERTIRYYDQIGLLKPSYVKENGYRQYSEKDFIKLQKIVALRHLGFSLEEIYPMVEEETDIRDSFRMQIDLIDRELNHLQSLRDALAQVASHEADWQEVVSVVQLFNQESKWIENYKDANQLNIRIALHDQFSVNPKGWFPWLYEHIDFSRIMRLLEIGCGNGKLWENRTMDLRHREIFLSDLSEGMVEEVRRKLGKDFNCIVIDGQHIPFKDDYFDALIANHVLFYIKDLDQCMAEMHRVLRPGGVLYCTTYGKEHMKEIEQLAQAFDKRVKLSDQPLADAFGAENGEQLLREHFSDVQRIDYPDSLRITAAQPLINYIMSCHGNQNEILAPQLPEFKKFLQSFIDKKGYIEVKKQAVLFTAKV
ncbi:MerR family transcriptional regulator [Catenisphaera adipataccumulans]|jgi:DNA-binding transcriptional MerR regulator/trans-aconitate methyltransferase|uniref:DNA-binding transcriptional MerR regulator n=1 Tax=Catenisphaera adipataccumulans TaxID=700500 RepID=A0A7W8CXV8_9FIRM|nr:MerR family transcriptional regulator [Catenisphaera adipataccumulans]MBB5182894.1 DNA-binding transcriptional MerR regulator [Catenisphaera adipataccumulans]